MMAVVIPIRFARTDVVRRERIVSVLQNHGYEVRRSDVEGLGELYLLRANAGLSARGHITDALHRHVPGWEEDVDFYWPE
jgi:hypothetical protein